MRFLTIVAAYSITASAASISRSNANNDTVLYPTYDALYDGQCFYPKPTPNFNLNSYLGKWYQVAGYPFGPTAGARCINAEYSLNDNGTVKVVNTAKLGDFEFSITGYAAAAPKTYGKAGVFKVEFPGISPPTACEGPNYIVQEFCNDYAIVQTQNWTTLYVLSRDQHPAQAKIDEWVKKAVNLGSDPTKIMSFNQTGC